MRYIITAFLVLALNFSSTSAVAACANVGQACFLDSNCCSPTCAPGNTMSFGYEQGKNIGQNSDGPLIWDANKSWSVNTKCGWSFKCQPTYLNGNACDGKMSR